MSSSSAPSTQLASSATLCRDDLFRGMRCVDLTGNPRIAVLMELVGAISRADDPREVLRVYSEGMRRLNGPRGYISLSTRGLKPGEYRITRLLTQEGTSDLHSADPWSTSGRIPVHTGGFFGEIIRKAYPELIHGLNVPNDPVVGNALAPFRSMMALPLFDGGEPLNWAIILSDKPEGFSMQDLEEHILRANLVGGTVRTVLMARELREANRRIEREVEQIARIQRTLLPETMPEITGISLAASYHTFSVAGGDYYDFIPLRYFEETGEPDPDGPWGIIIADASGHGPAAAVVMAMLHAILHAFPKLPEGPAEVMEHVNRHLSAKRIESSFVTAFFAVYDPPTRTLTYARAGHNPPLLKNPGSGGAVRRLDDIGGIPLGVLMDTTYDQQSITLEPGQTLVLYTDGITEATCTDGTMFGIEGMEAALTECTGQPDCVVGSVNTALRDHEGTVQPNDDQTLVALRVHDDA